MPSRRGGAPVIVTGTPTRFTHGQNRYVFVPGRFDGGESEPVGEVVSIDPATLMGVRVPSGYGFVQFVVPDIRPPWARALAMRAGGGNPHA